MDRRVREELERELSGERPICDICGRLVPYTLGRPDYHILFGKDVCPSCADRMGK